MCGITGIFTKGEKAEENRESVNKAMSALRHRGPDNQGVFNSANASLGHTRLSIIDTSVASNQPFYSLDKRHVII